MAFSRPTLTELISRTVADMSSRVVNSVGSVLRRSLLGVIARVIAGASHQLHGHMDWISRQILPDTADDDQLDRHGNLWGVERKAADYAAGDVDFIGTNGSVIPALTVLVRSDGVEYTTDAEVTISAGVATAAVTCSTAGTTGNTDAAATLSLQSPISGVNSTGTVASGGIIGGDDIETDDDYRARISDRIQQPPNGGSEDDYVTWAKEVAGVTRAWCYPSYLGAGTVGVTFTRDDDVSIIPDSGEVAEVQDYIDAVRPVTADLTVFAPTPVSMNMTIAISPNTAAVQAAITAEVEDLLLREAEPGGTILLSHLREAVSIAAGEADHDMTIPSADVTHAAGQLAVLGTITFSSL